MTGVTIFDFDAGEVITTSNPPDPQMAALRACAEAMRAGKREEFIRLLDKCRGCIDEPLENGQRLVHVATGIKNVFYLKSIVEAGVNIDLRSVNTGLLSSLDVVIGTSALVYAVFHGASDHIDYLISQKADPACCDKNGDSVIFSCLGMFYSLSARGAEKSEKLEAFCHLLPHVDLTQRNIKGETVMTCAIGGTYPDVVSRLKDHGCPVLVEDIAYAIGTGCFLAASFLVDGGFALSSTQEVREIERAMMKDSEPSGNQSFIALFRAITNFTNFKENKEACIDLGHKLVSDFHRRLECSIDRIYTGGDKPLPLPQRRR